MDDDNSKLQALYQRVVESNGSPRAVEALAKHGYTVEQAQSALDPRRHDGDSEDDSEDDDE